MSEKLLPCPFCGGESRIREYKDVEFLIHNADCFMVQCDRCGCGTSYEATKAEAIAAWNRRASGWISVKDGLPDNMQYCAVVRNTWDATCARFEHDAFVGLLRVDGEGFEYDDVTYWMPLPEEPKRSHLPLTESNNGGV